ncbi:MAG: glycine cleavage system protein GcvH [bacterium]|nr:glycine cleavage system protein GcvH [bacterium]
MYPDDCMYTTDHEWVREEDGVYAVGITEFAVEQLGDITYVEVPDMGAEFHQGDAAATVESVKAASDVYAPVAGTVCEVNDALEAQPELVNQSPYDLGWFFKLEDAAAKEYKALMNLKAYEAFVAEQAE